MPEINVCRMIVVHLMSDAKPRNGDKALMMVKKLVENIDLAIKFQNRGTVSFC